MYNPGLEIVNVYAAPHSEFMRARGYQFAIYGNSADGRPYWLADTKSERGSRSVIGKAAKKFGLSVYPNGAH